MTQMTFESKVRTSDRPVTTTTLLKMKQAEEKIACLTTYDASFTHLLEEAWVDVMLVGDSLGMVIQGHETTLSVNMEEMIYHTRNVARAQHKALLVVDMPFMSYATLPQALDNAARLMKEGGAHVVKLEGGSVQVDIVHHLIEHGIPVCGHLGLLPQSVHAQGGYRVQGRDEGSANRIIDDALALQEAGASMLVLECVPILLAEKISAMLDIPTIGIGAGGYCDGQVLVLYDILGISPGKRTRFTKDFLAETGNVLAAIKRYVHDVKSSVFPGPEHSFEQ